MTEAAHLIPPFAQSLAPDMGTAGNTAIFLFLMVGQIIIGLAVFSYLGHKFLAVIERTAAGSDVISWPSEPAVDWLGEGIQLAYLLSLTAVPAGFVLRLAKLPFLPIPSVRMTVGIAVAIWLLLPIFLLCSMAASSRWSFLHAGMLGRLARCPRTLFVFYVVSGGLLGGCAYVWYLAFQRSQFLVWVGAATALATTVLIYARLLGRLGWVASQVKVAEAEEPAKKKRKRPPARGVRSTDPWSMPEPEPKPAPPAPKPPPAKSKGSSQIQAKGPNPNPKPKPPADEDDEWSGGSYGLAPEDKPNYPQPPPARRPPEDDEDDEPIQMEPMSEDDWEEARHQHTIRSGSHLEDEILRPREEIPPPPFPLVNGVYTFPWYGNVVQVWITLIFCFTVFGLVFDLILSFSPIKPGP